MSAHDSSAQHTTHAERRREHRAELNLWYATLTVTLASGVMSTIGVYEVLGSSRPYGLALSMLLGIVITAMLSAAWRYLFCAFPRAEGSTLGLLGLLLVPFLVLVFFISTWTNATAILGGPALNMHSRHFLDQYEEALNAVGRQVDASAHTLAALRAEARTFRADMEGEEAEGRLTGFAGRGLVSATLKRIADQLDALVLEAERAAVAMAEQDKIAADAFVALEAHLASGKNDPAIVKANVEIIRNAVIAMNEQSPAAIIAAVLPTMGMQGGIASPTPTTDSTALAARQADAIGAVIAPRIADTLTALQRLASETSGQEIAPPRYEHLTIPQAAMRYMDQFPIYWAMAVAIDAMPLLFLMLLTITAPRAQAELDLTVGELQHALRVYADLRERIEGADNVALLAPTARRARS